MKPYIIHKVGKCLSISLDSKNEYHSSGEGIVILCMEEWYSYEAVQIFTNGCNGYSQVSTYPLVEGFAPDSPLG